MTGKVLAVLRRSDHAMTVRMVLHGAATVISATYAFFILPAAPMWQQMMWYALAWIACALAYIPLLFLWELALDALDDRVRRIMREEFERYELTNYQRALDATIRRRIEGRLQGRTHTRD